MGLYHKFRGVMLLFSAPFTAVIIEAYTGISTIAGIVAVPLIIAFIGGMMFNHDSKKRKKGV